MSDKVLKTLAVSILRKVFILAKYDQAKSRQ